MAMMVSALPTASATQVEPLSEYAGKTIAVQVTEETDNGLVSRLIEVAIPMGATKAVETALINDASVSSSTHTAFSVNSVDESQELLGSKYNFTVTGDVSTLCRTTLSRNYNKIVVNVNIKEMDHSGQRLCLQYINGSSASDWVNIPFRQGVYFYTFVKRADYDGSTSETPVNMSSGDTIQIDGKAYLATGYIDFNSCTVVGYY